EDGDRAVAVEDAAAQPAAANAGHVTGGTAAAGAAQCLVRGKGAVGNRERTTVIEDGSAQARAATAAAGKFVDVAAAVAAAAPTSPTEAGVVGYNRRRL